MPKFGIPIPIRRSCGVHYRNISGIYLKQPPGLHHANHHVFQYWIYIILMAVILISMYQCWAILSFFCENLLVSVLTSCYENLIDSLIYFFLLVRIDQVIKIFKFSTFTRFSNRAVLPYIIIDDFQIWFSQLGSHIFRN
jgi:hypothetical protein